ncbi:MAG TPA: T9SS type A sorting domain-containing protein [Ignavibacteria bacterium]|nr:T9SS type A sorting domain-containing protein [Ignavibacteria bacterium]HRJ98306.1 T9SS type A sorting domain-containing protein [Ignavibacteria bacterium]
MTTFNLKATSAVLVLITGLSLILLNRQLSAGTSPDFIFGKVLYSDDHSPVTEGNVKIMTLDPSSRTYNVLEVISINSDGSFKISRKIILSTDDIRIMAYPNDVDNNELPFIPAEIGFDNQELTEKADYEIIIEVDRTSGIKNEDQGSVDKKKFYLGQNFPNPFNPVTSIRFELPESNNVSLKIYNMKGETVAVLAENELLRQGFNELEFNAGNLPSGTYVYTLRTDNFTENKKMMLLK